MFIVFGPRRQPLRAACVGLAALTAAVAVAGTPAQAGSTAQVRIVDRWDHGGVKVWVNGAVRYVTGGHSTGFFAVNSSYRHGGVSVGSTRYPGCGEGEPGSFFKAGQRYKILVRASPPPGGCSVGNGKTIPGLEFTITKIS